MPRRGPHYTACPMCLAGSGMGCSRSNGARLMGYHRARHIAAKTFFVWRPR